MKRAAILASVLSLVATTFVTYSAIPASAAAFTSGDLVAVRVGDGSFVLSSSAANVFLDEFTTGGALQQSIPLPNVVSSGNRRLTLSGSSTSEGTLARSSDGNYLTLAGYDALVGTASVSTTTSAAVNRVVGRIDASGAVDTTTAITDGFSGSNVRGAVTDDGTRFWMTGASAGAVGGVRLAPFGLAGPTVQVAATPDNTRAPLIANGQLYVSSASNPNQGVSTVGTGLPTTAAQTLTLLPGVSAAGPGQFALLDRDPNVNGLDTLYIADGSGLLKFSFDGVTWTARGSISGGAPLLGIAARTSGANAEIYVTSTSSIAALTDTAGFNATITGSISTIATAPANTAFRGLAFAVAGTPPPAVPEAPLAAGLLGLVAVIFGAGYFVLRRRATRLAA